VNQQMALGTSNPISHYTLTITNQAKVGIALKHFPTKAEMNKKRT